MCVTCLQNTTPLHEVYIEIKFSLMMPLTSHLLHRLLLAFTDAAVIVSSSQSVDSCAKYLLCIDDEMKQKHPMRTHCVIDQRKAMQGTAINLLIEIN